MCCLWQRVISLLMVFLVSTVGYICVFREALVYWESGRGIGCDIRFVFVKLLIDWR